MLERVIETGRVGRRRPRRIEPRATPMLSVQRRDELAADLAEAERSRAPIAPLTDENPTIDVVSFPTRFS